VAVANEPLVDVCAADGGRFTSEVRGDKLIRTCMRCGIEERLDYKEPDEDEIKLIAELERSLTEETDDDPLDSDQAMYAKEDDAALAAEDARRIERRPPVDKSMAEPPFGVQRQRRVPVSTDWREVAKARLAALIEQLTTAEEAAREAQEIYVALSACGIRLDPLPECVHAIVEQGALRAPLGTPSETAAVPQPKRGRGARTDGSDSE
jgi:hypothetical protein